MYKFKLMYKETLSKGICKGITVDKYTTHPDLFSLNLAIDSLLKRKNIFYICFIEL